ncbi:DsbA family protein [Candidatus Parcubacteria bacterium]|nr:DsbA family protein [Candidatus Parcubacteria bacterium]
MMPETNNASHNDSSRGTQQFTIPLAIILAGGMIASAVYFGGGHGGAIAAAGSLTGSNTPEGKVEPVSGKDHMLGDANAPITIVEYSDLECPFCKVFHDTMHQVLATYAGKVNWVYRHFPIAQLHSKAPMESEASECAADQGGNTAFWSYIDKIFATTGSNNTLDPAELPRIAQGLGLDVTQFNKCLTNGTHGKEITDDVTAAINAGAQGTPYSVIIMGDKQIVVNGAEPYESVKAKIDSLLK